MRVIVVDVDAFGVSLIRDLHAVFPLDEDRRALTSGPKQMIASLKAGASIALPRSTPASVSPAWSRDSGEAGQAQARQEDPVAARTRRPAAHGTKSTNALQSCSAAWFPERLVAAGVCVCRPGGDEQKVRQSVEVGEHERVDRVLFIGRERVALRAAARRARDVQSGSASVPPGRMKLLEHRQVRVQLVAELFKPIHGGLVDAEAVK